MRYHVGTLFQFNAYSISFRYKITFYHVHTMFYTGRPKSRRGTTTLVEVTRSPFSQLPAFGDFVSGFDAFSLSQSQHTFWEYGNYRNDSI